MPSTLLWFRRDLRLHDLPPLLEAAAGGADVLGCFVLDPRLEKSSGARRLQFLGDSLRALNDAMGGRLLIIRGRPEERIPELCAAVGASAVHVSADFSPFGVRRDSTVSAALADAGVAWQATGSPYLVSPGRVTKDDGTPTRSSPRSSRAGRKSAGARLPPPRRSTSAGSIRPGCPRVWTRSPRRTPV